MSSSKRATLPLAGLVEDWDIYPRHAVDRAHVQALVFALETGATLPPIVADRKSKRITDGWHRAHAYRRFLGPDATVDVELVSYPNETAMKLDAVARNAAHGRRLDAIDRKRCVIILQSAGLSNSEISAAMRMPENRVEKLAVKVATAPPSSGQVVPGTNKVALKRCVAHLEGQRLSKSQAAVHGSLPGTSWLLVARQLYDGLRENMVNLEDEKLVAQLRLLRDLLNEKIKG